MRNASSNGIQLGELCRRLDVRERDARYVLEQGHVPEGVEVSPESGNYRQFGPGPAFWLSMVLKLKESGLKTALAAQVATYADQSLRGVAQNLNWDWQFLPQAGRFDTVHQYYVDVGDLKALRFVTNAKPGSPRRWEEFGWYPMERSGKTLKDFEPFVVYRLNLTRIARALAGGFALENS